MVLYTFTYTGVNTTMIRMWADIICVTDDVFGWNMWIQLLPVFSFIGKYWVLFVLGYRGYKF